MFQGIDPKPNVRLEKAIDNKVSGSLTILLVTIFCIGSGAEISTIAQILLQDKYKKKNLNSNKREKKIRNLFLLYSSKQCISSVVKIIPQGVSVLLNSFIWFFL